MRARMGCSMPPRRQRSSSSASRPCIFSAMASAPWSFRLEDVTSQLPQQRAA